jgi:4-hydroxy-tetrahydrodipicolinate reductase
MIAAGMKWQLDDIQETIEPIVAQTRIRSEFLTVEPGQAAGVKQLGRGIKDGKDAIVLEFQAYLGAEDPFDAVSITGSPNIETVIKGGTHGDLATIAMVVNAIPRVVAAQAGLLTMMDIPLVYSLSGNS